jgi:ribosome biogenesis GTPase A
MSIEDQTTYTKEIGEYLMKDVLVKQNIDSLCKLLDAKVEYVDCVDPRKTCKKIVITYAEQKR